MNKEGRAKFGCSRTFEALAIYFLLATGHIITRKRRPLNFIKISIRYKVNRKLEFFYIVYMEVKGSIDPTLPIFVMRHIIIRKICSLNFIYLTD